MIFASKEGIKIVADRLGHSSVQTTRNIYSHQIQSADAVAADNIAEMLKKGRENRDNNNKTD